ncbi:histidine kinase, partial [Parabacteroides distasonis]
TEIREIGEEFTGMMADISQLNRQIFDTATDLYEMKVKKQEAELSYMRSQIDPHFLYNTLEVFRKKALERKAPEIAEMAVDMGNIFRYSTKGSQTVTLGEEVSIIKSYVRIQKNR